MRSHSRASRISANAASSTRDPFENSSASTARRPGAHVVRSRSNSRSLSNSRTSCALRTHCSVSITLCRYSPRLQRRGRGVHQFAVRFAPRPDARSSTSRTRSRIGRQKSPSTANGFAAHHRFVQHLPHHRKLHQRARSAFAGHKTIAPGASVQTIFPARSSCGLPCRSTRWPCGCEKFRRHPVRFSAGFFCSARNRFHHAAVAAAAHRKSRFASARPSSARFLIVRFVFARPRTAEHRDDAAHFAVSAVHFSWTRFLQHAAPAASNSSIIAMLSASSASVAS